MLVSDNKLKFNFKFCCADLTFAIIGQEEDGVYSFSEKAFDFLLTTK